MDFDDKVDTDCWFFFWNVGIIARPKGVPPKAARPKDGLFRLHASWIYLSYAGFDCLAAILCH